MSCHCAETNFMDGRGHDPGCPLWKPSPAVPEAQTVPIPRYKPSVSQDGTIAMKSMSNGAWIKYSDHLERIARDEATIAELKNSAEVALPILREDRDSLVDCATLYLPDGTKSSTPLNDDVQVFVDAYNNAIALCETAIARATGKE